MATQGQLGVTPPLSDALPTESENLASKALVDELKRQNNYETQAESNKRSQVLDSLQKITEEFVRQVSEKQGYRDNFLKSVGGKIATFGSYKLGVVGPGSDIDTLVVAPKNITKDDFFEHFPRILNTMAPEGAITELVPKPDAFAPCITLKYSGIDLDLLFGRIDYLNQITKEQSLLGPEVLRGLTDQEVRSLNGVRVADELLSLVPEQSIFRTALRTIKLWGTRRAIAGNIYGFPGGVAWAILVARICQLYPKATSSTIVLKFFKIYDQWQWPMPVLLKAIGSGALNLKVWNPRIYASDRNHIMPIITPAYPSMCTTHNFTKSTMAVLQKEMRRGGNITDQIMMGKAQWKELFTKHTFFTDGYKYYLSVISASTSKEEQMLWAGFVESKVRLLIAKVEEHDSISLAHPFNKGFTRVHRCRTDEEIEQVKTGSMKFHAKDVATATTGHGLTVEATVTKVDAVNEDQKSKDEENITEVFTTSHYIGLQLREGAKSLDLSWQVEEFKKLCTSLPDKYNPETNALAVAHVKNYDLPDDVFGEGEIKPARPQKKTKANGAPKKRTLAEDAGAPPAKRQQQASVAAVA